MKRLLTAVIPVLAVCGVCLFKDRIYFRIYPVIMGLIAFSAFLLSLFSTPLCERVARARHGDLPPEGVGYCRRLTVVWTVFLALNSLVGLVTVFLPLGVWIFYNAFLSYLLIGALMLGEYLYRRRALDV